MTTSKMISTRARPRLLAGLAAGAAPYVSGRRSARAAEQPDIVVLLMNDARDGDQIALPQTMEHLADNGTTFPNFFLTTPLCGPSRASFFTGLYAHNHGVSDNRGAWDAFVQRNNRGRTTGVLLQNAGYRTAAIGGYLNGSQPGSGKEPGWDIGPRAGRRKKQRTKGNDRTRRRGKGGDRAYAASAAALIAETAVEQPLYVDVGFGTPHVPVNPIPPYAGQFAGAQVDRDPSFDEENVTDKPRYIRDQRRLNPRDEVRLDSLHQRRLEKLLELDDSISDIWDALEERGRLENTYVFLATDNGMSLGHHRIYGKMVPYDTSARMPLFAFGPRFAEGAVDERFVGNIDLAPTLVELAGANAPAMDGRSLLSGHDRDAILLELVAPNLNSMSWNGPIAEIPRYRAVRNAMHLYVEYHSGERELYDYADDPHEVNNLLAGNPSPEHDALAAQLSARLGELRNCRGATCS